MMPPLANPKILANAAPNPPAAPAVLPAPAPLKSPSKRPLPVISCLMRSFKIELPIFLRTSPAFFPSTTISAKPLASESVNCFTDDFRASNCLILA
jgi:hypothetical protein